MSAMALTYRKAQMEDAELLWRWANDPETRRNSFSKSPIAYGDHMSWLEKRLKSPETTIWIFSDENTPVGQVRIDVAREVAEIHIAVAPSCRGRSYGKAMLACAIRLLREEKGEGIRVMASVLGQNFPSLRLFKGCGFKEVDVVEQADGERAIVFELMR